MLPRAAFSKRLTDWPFLAAIGISLVAAALRIQPLSESLWLDELHTAWCAVGPLDDVARRAAIGNQAPLFFWLQWLALRILGPSELSLRLISFVSGSLLPLAVFLIARRWTTAWVGLIAASLMTVNAGGIFYSTEARPYALLQLLAVCHIAITAELISRPSIPLRGSWVAVAAALFYLHFTTALIVPAELLVYVLARAFRLPSISYTWRSVALDMTVLAVVCLPAAGALSIVMARRANWDAFGPLKPLLVIFDWWPCALGLAYVATTLAIDRLMKQDEPSAARRSSALLMLLLLSWLLVPPLLAWTIARTGTARLFYERYLVICAPAAGLLAAYCADLAPWRWSKLGIGLLLIAAAISSSDIYPRLYHEGRVIEPRGEDWRGCVAWLNERLPESGLPVLVYSGLIEADELTQPHDELFEDYCLAPVTSLYPLDIDRGDLFPLALREPGKLDQAGEMLIVHRGGAWLIVRGEKKAGAQIAEEIMACLRSAEVAETNAHWRVKESQSFGKVQVLLLTADAKDGQEATDPSVAGP